MRIQRRLLVLGLLAGLPGLAWGQGSSTAGMGTSDGLPPGLRTNMFADPVLNPFLNPYAASAAGQVGRDELLLYYLAARQSAAAQGQRTAASGGRRASARMPTQSRPQPAEMPYRMMSPGGSAGSFFHRNAGSSPGAQGIYGHYYGRYGRHFDHNGR